MSITPIRYGASALVALALVLSSTGLAGNAHNVQAAEDDVFVNIYAYVDGELATAASTDSFTFPMNATWNATSTGSGSGSFELDADNGYTTMTAALSSGADYSLEADTSSDEIGASCDEEGVRYAVTGYSVGATEAEAQAATPTSEAPSFTDLTTDQHVIVWFDDCATPVEGDTAQITIIKYLDGEQATATSAASSTFTFSASWNDEGGVGTGSGNFTLDTESDVAYETQTTAFLMGADYSFEEVMDDTTGESCDAGTPFRLVGYTTGETRVEAENGTVSTTAPSFTNLDGDRYVIVWNETCDEEPGEGTLAVSSIETIDGTGVANGSYADGWVYMFNITVPTDETSLAVRFSDWTGSAGTMAAAGNIRISSEQADNNGATIEVSAANTYSSPELTITGDLDPSTPGHQIRLRVEVRIPEGTNNGTYTTTYGIRTQ